MRTSTLEPKRKTVVSLLHARNNLGRLLDNVDGQQRSVVIEKRGVPRAVLLSISNYVKLAAPEPEILRILGEKSVRNGTNKLTLREINQEIQAVRTARKKR